MLPFELVGTDPTYEEVRLGTNQKCAEARKYVTDLWGRLDGLLDPNFLEDLGREYYQRLWELYLGVSLLESGFELERKKVADGPDFKIKGDPPVWVEARAPTPGANESEDRVPDQPSGCHSIPDEKIKLRITGAFWDKFQQLQRHRRKGLIGSRDPCVIAISGSRIPHGSKERGDLPRIVRALLPFGYETVQISRATGTAVGRGHQYQAEIVRSSGDNIPTNAFQDHRFSLVSAVLYSAADDLNHPNVGHLDLSQSGRDLVVFQNPLAENPLPRNWLGRGSTFWVEKELQNSVDVVHSENLNVW